MDKSLRLQVIFDGIDRLSAPIKAIGGSSQELTRRLSDNRKEMRALERQAGQLAGFKALQKDVGETGTRMVEAERRAAELGRAIEGVEKPTREMTKEFRDAQREADRLSKEFDTKQGKLNQLADGLGEAGRSSRAFADEESRIRSELARTTAEIEKQENHLQRLADMRKRGERLQEIGGNISSAGRTASLAVTAPVAAAGFLTMRTAGDFEASMNQVGAIANANPEEFAMLRDAARQTGATTQFSASESADALTFLAMAGFKARESIDALPGTLQLSAAAGLDLGRSADIVSNVLTGYNKPVAELGHVNDVLVKAFTSSNTNLEQLGEAMKYAGPVASTAGVRFEEAAAAIGMMGNAGIQGSMAGTSLRGAISRILNPTKQVATAMASAGLKFTDANGRLLPLVDIVRQLEPHAEDAGMMMQLFGQRAGPAMAALVGQGADALAEFDQQLQDSEGTAQRVGEAQMKGLNGQIKLLKSAFEELQLAIGDSGALEKVTDLVSRAADFIQRLSMTNPELMRWATLIALAAATVGPLLMVLGKLISTYGFLLKMLPLLARGFLLLGKGALKAGAMMMANPMVLVIMAIVAAVGIAAYLIYIHWDTIKAAFGSAVEWIAIQLHAFMGLMRGIWDGITSRFDQAVAWVQGFWQRFTARLSAGWAIVQALFWAGIAMLGAAWQNIRGAFGAGIDWIMGLVGRFRQAGADLINGLIGGIGDRAAAIRDRIVGIAQDIKGWFSRTLGIRSPSRVFMAFGGDITDGLDRGLDRGAADPLGRVRTLARDLGAAFAVTASLPAAAHSAPLPLESPQIAAVAGLQPAIARVEQDRARISDALARGDRLRAEARSFASAPVSQSAAPARPIQIHNHIAQMPGQSADDLAAAIAAAVRVELERIEREEAAARRSAYQDD